MRLINKKLIEQRFAASAKSYDHYALAQKQVYADLTELLESLGQRHYNKVLEIGCGTAGLSKYLDERFEVSSWTLNDLGRKMFDKGAFNQPRFAEAIHFIEGDAERVDLGQGYDLVVSSSAIQWFHEPKAFLSSLLPRLIEGGVLLISSFGKDNLHEMKSLTERGLSYHSKEEYADFLKEAGYEILACQEEYVPLYFASAREVLRHLKHTGVTALGGNGQTNFWTKTKLADFEQAYKQNFSNEEGFVSLTYQPIYLLARKKS